MVWHAYRADMRIKTIDFGECVRSHCSYLANTVELCFFASLIKWEGCFFASLIKWEGLKVKNSVARGQEVWSQYFPPDLMLS